MNPAIRKYLGPSAYYVYPEWHVVSFTLVARQHIKHLRNLGVRVYTVDEIAFDHLRPHTQLPVFIHPAIHILSRVAQSRGLHQLFRAHSWVKYWKSLFGPMIGVDVADSDEVSQEALAYLDPVDHLVVPSEFSKQAFARSGWSRPISVVPHGVDEEWYYAPSVWDERPHEVRNPDLWKLFALKRSKNVKIVLYWLWHSDHRKGWPEVREAVSQVLRDRSDVLFVMKKGTCSPVQAQELPRDRVFVICSWLTETEKMALYDLADVSVMLSRGGAFEMNCLEALARGVPCVAHKCCGWADYVPDFLAVRKWRRVKPLPGNRIHVGYGWSADPQDAYRKIMDVLDNPGKYREAVQAWRASLAKRYTWRRAGELLYELLAQYI